MASSDQTKMVWEKRWVGRPAGTHFSAGGTSPLARSNDSNKLMTQAKLGPLVDDKWRPSGAAFQVVVEAAVRLATAELARYLKTRRAAAKEQRNSNLEASEVDSQAEAAELTALDGAVTADFAKEVDVVLEEHQASMSGAEAQERLLAVLVAAAFIAEQMRVLSNARIVDASPELRNAMNKLTVPQLTDSMNRMLQANASLLDDETSAGLMKIFGGGRFVDGQYLPLRNEKIKDVLRLSEGDR
jgi:hypothetical protein